MRAAIAEFGFTPEEVFGKPGRAKTARGARRARKPEGGKHERANLDLFGDAADKT